ncbi:hypothetical protein PHYBOEH_009486 [Phytophthora boehmeriae]|uniref:Uncharacterized protein n=1 Tax=Phytophthora boehmeriae TaxID=109152 RepID=A0A8T1X7V7_9STRA|nr:hypothetical protein PHYBOEH_009486 [Phytophthora boehmeriae]
MFMWMAVGLGPIFLQCRGYASFMTPHKISLRLVTPVETVPETADLFDRCPVEWLFMAGAWWNISPTNYYRVEGGLLCHYLMPQYNVHGNYFLGTHKTATLYHTVPRSCANESYPFENYFYHGSIGYYSFYIEGQGTYCALDNAAYDKVLGLGTYDTNGANLIRDGGESGYRKSYWYGLTGIAWIVYRCWVVRRSFIMCKRFARRCSPTSERITLQGAMVFVQESMRLSAHGAKNYHRVLILFLLLDLGLMSDLFLLITQEGFLGRIQCISLGYNLAAIISVLFEMVETMNWMREKVRCLVKRLLFNYETALVGELLTAILIQSYITSLNRSDLRHTETQAKLLSYYIMSLIGHGCIALGCLVVIICTRTIGTLAFMWWRYRSLTILSTPCSVDMTLGARCKMILLAGYTWENGTLFYRASTLRAFGLSKMTEEDGGAFMVYSKCHWFAITRKDLVVCGIVSGHVVEPCEEHACLGVVTDFDRMLGGVGAEVQHQKKDYSPRKIQLKSSASATSFENRILAVNEEPDE